MQLFKSMNLNCQMCTRVYTRQVDAHGSIMDMDMVMGMDMDMGMDHDE